MFITEEEFKTTEGVNKALERLMNRTIEATLKFMPEIVAGLALKDQMIKSSLSKFKQEFPEFKGREAELAQLIQDIELQNGALSLDEILARVPDKFKDLSLEIPPNQPQTIEELETSCNGII